MNFSCYRAVANNLPNNGDGNPALWRDVKRTLLQRSAKSTDFPEEKQRVENKTRAGESPALVQECSKKETERRSHLFRIDE
jgi:hypothetical protein